MNKQRPGPIGRRSAALAMAGVVVYALVDVVLQLLPPHYNPISAAESNLAVGPFGWLMNLNFLGRAATTVAAVVAIGTVGPSTRLRRAGLALLLCGGACSAVLAFLPADVPASGHLTVTDHTSVGIAHLAVASTGFLAALAGITVLTVWLRGSGRPAAFPAAAALAVVTGAGVLALGLATVLTPALLGLAERVCLAGILGWTFSVCASVRSGSSAIRNLAR